MDQRNQRPKGKSRINEIAAEFLREQGLDACPRCSTENLVIYHNTEPCPKQPSSAEAESSDG